jgi:hypothetical protein
LNQQANQPVAAMSASSTPLSKAIKARRATVLESYFISSQNSANSGPICLSDASPRKRAKLDSPASSSGSKPNEDCSTPARANVAVKLICPGGLPSNPDPHSTSISVESASDVVEVINVTDSEVPVAKKTQKKCKGKESASRKCQDNWALAHPWAEMLRAGKESSVDRVQCIVYTSVKGRPVVMGAKSDTLEKHAGKRQAKVDLPHLNVKKDEYYINPKCGHLKAVPIYNAQSLHRPTILQQVSVFHLSHVCSFHIFYMPI